MHSKKLALGLLAAVAMVSFSAHAEFKGTAEVSSSHAHVSGPMRDTNVNSGSVLLDLDKGHQFGIGAAHAHAWGAKASQLNLRSVNPIGQGYWLDSHLDMSDKGSVFARNHGSSMLNWRVPAHNLVLGAGVDYFDMRGGADALSLKVKADYQVQSMPLVLHADALWSDDLLNTGSGGRLGVGATYGQVGQWTVSTRYETGRAQYETVKLPAGLNAGNSKRLEVGARHWVNKDWGVSLNLAHVDHRVYQRNGVVGGLFWNL